MANYLEWDDPAFGTPQYDPVTGQQTSGTAQSQGIGGPTTYQGPVAQGDGAGHPDQIQISSGSTPDYASIIRNDPGYLAAQSAANEAAKGAVGTRQAALRQALIAYGGVMPGGFKDTYGDIDQATLDLAAHNQQSTLAGLARGLTQKTLDLRRSLAARGMLQSGDLGYGLNQLNTDYAQSQYNAAQDLSNTWNTAIGAYTGVLNTNRANLATALGQAESFAYQNYHPTSAQYANYDADSSAKYGKSIYKYEDPGTGQITYYTQDAKVFNG